MNANKQMNRLSTEIADLIVKLVNDTDGPVTLAEVERVIPGFAKKDRPNWGYVIEGSNTEQLIWVGMSEAGYLALRQIIAERRVAVQVVNILPYLLENRVITTMTGFRRCCSQQELRTSKHPAGWSVMHH